MDKRALYRAKLKEQKQKQIDSPLVRYNEHDQPVCRVCDVVLKSESQWPGHQASRKHHEAISNLKANAAAAKNLNNVKSEPPKELPKTKPQISEGLNRKEPEPSAALPKPRASSMLPPNFFDQQETKRPKIDKDSARLGDHVSLRGPPVSDRTEEVEPSSARFSIQGLSTSKNAETRSMENQQSGENGPMSKVSSGSDAKQVKGALPAGFFDNKDADLRARGITPVKPDVKDEYKEFEKLIQEDLKEVDNRLEEEEIDAAEMIEEEVSVEQRGIKERLEMLRRKKMELKAAKSSLGTRESKIADKESSDDESSSDSDENLTVDWRAKHL
ncbi:protein ABA AND ROS SENSITIVE 1 [Capsicum galapagoense]